jgi:DNA-binding NarL/FixJ family response regulator
METVMDEVRSTGNPGSHPADSLTRELPLIGRGEERAKLRALLLEESRFRVVIVSGAGGVGKSRLAAAACEDARRSGWEVASGRAYPVESGIAYGLFADAFVPILSGMSETTLASLTRGGEAELGYLFPSLRGEPEPGTEVDWSDPQEFRTRILWNFSEFLRGYSKRQPLLVFLDDLQWADESSLELLHFLVRHVDEHPIRFLCAYNEGLRDQSPALRRMEGSLLAQGATRSLRLGPLSRDDVGSRVGEVFGVDAVVSHDLVERLHDWTLGNPLFVLETLKALVESGRLHRRGDVWLGWEDTTLELPGSVREGMLIRLARFSEHARSVADLAAVVGGPVSHRTLEDLADLSVDDLVAAVRELTSAQVLEERSEGPLILYDLAHPLIREVLYGDLGLARARQLHAEVASAVERAHGSQAMRHADQIAYHLVRSRAASLTPKALQYLIAAGRHALERHAGVEAAHYLEGALSILDEESEPEAGQAELDVTRGEVLALLAQARQRQGRYADALELWAGALDVSPESTPEMVSSVRRSMGVACYWCGRHVEAIRHLDEARSHVPEGDLRQAAVIRLTRGVCHQELGAPEKARADINATLATAERLEDVPLLARAHRALALLHTWVGPPEEGRAHAREAIRLADACGDSNVAFWSHWALAALEGLTGDTTAMEAELVEARRIADDLGSPVLRIWSDELSLERAYALGEWETAVSLGEQAIALARSLNQRTLLPRLLVWTSLIYLSQGELERGRAMVDEAWTLAGLDEGEDRVLDVHTAVPAHIGLAAYYLFSDQREKAVEVGERGLEIADRSGYVVWAIHHLLPIIAESLIHTRDLARARSIGDRLRRDSERLGHPLGLAWAKACTAFVVWLEGDLAKGAEMLRDAAEALEAIPIVPDAVRVRRQLARRLAELGDREGALRELRDVHGTMVRLGLKRELDKARVLFRSLDARPPLLSGQPGSGDLTGRELEIAELVAEGESNKSISRRLGVSPRTVTTHLQNVYRKLEISSRNQLAELIREGKIRRS